MYNLLSSVINLMLKVEIATLYDDLPGRLPRVPNLSIRPNCFVCR